ncbi:adhesion G-protein coupled receptor G4-like [Musca autumnalis]|uniref:adhesion G-protein coupled receptor G4-like n=1 Tax=Musca autumnalis TaxID=221902 RepID=UPI003CEF6CDF
MLLRPFILISVCFVAVGTKEFCKKDIYLTELHTKKYNGTAQIDVLAIWTPAPAGILQIPGICSASTGLPFQRKCQRTEDSTTIYSKNSRDTESVELLDCNKISIVKQCKEESFEQYDIKKNNVTVKSTNKWPTTDMGEFANPINVCLYASGLSLRRKCSFNNKTYSAEWEKLESKIKCLKDINEHIVTEDLNTLYLEVKKENATGTIDSVDVTARLTNILSKNNNIQRTPTDLDFSTNILQMLTVGGKTELVASRVVGITNLLMESDEIVVLQSQATSTPKKLLGTVEEYFDDMTNVFMPNASDCTNLTDGVKYFIKNSTSVFYIYPACNNVSGIAVYSKSSGRIEMHYDSHTNAHFKYLYLNESLYDVLKEPNIIAAAYFPQTVWNDISKEYPGNHTKFLGLRISLYKNQNFFIEGNSRVPKTPILRASVPGYTDELPGNISYIFNKTQLVGKEAVQCGWYNLDIWSMTTISNIDSENVAVCETRSQHFGCLIGQKSKKYKINDILSILVSYSQDIITIVGCVLSLFGLSAIWLTAVCCKQWRRKRENLLKLNICLVLTLIMAYFLFINVTEMRQTFLNKFNLDYCFAEGVFLQYSILVLFSCMLILGILQYRKYITIFNYYVSGMDNVIYSLCAWGIPVIPTLLVACLDPSSYVPISEIISINNNICYPSGRSFYFGLFIPMAIICIVNISIYLRIICSLCCKTKPDYRHNKDNRDFILHLRLSILLFFLLGVSWLFGIWAHMQENEVLSCLFCLTATLQGFILFVYFVILDKKISKNWAICCCGKDYYITEDIPTTYNSIGLR